MFTYTTRLPSRDPASAYGTLFPVLAIVAFETWVSTHCHALLKVGRRYIDVVCSHAHPDGPQRASPRRAVVPAPTRATTVARTILDRDDRANHSTAAMMAAAVTRSGREAGAISPRNDSHPPMN